MWKISIFYNTFLSLNNTIKIEIGLDTGEVYPFIRLAGLPRTAGIKLNREEKCVFSKKFYIVAILVLAICAVLVFTPALTSRAAEESSQKYDIGACDRLKITVLAEEGWYDTDLYLSELAAGGGTLESQWVKNITMDNMTGVSYLVEVDGYTILYDPGCNSEWCKGMIADKGIDLSKVDLVYISHEHLDHFWALEGILELRPDVDLLIPNTFSDIAHNKIKEWGHTGKLYEATPQEPYQIVPGCASVAIAGPIMLDINGEQHMYFNVKDKGLVVLTGCAHMGSVTILEWAKEKIKYDNDNLHAFIGGMHICPFANWSPEYEDILVYFTKQDFDYLCPNHCAGKITGERMNVLMPDTYQWAYTGTVYEFGEGGLP